VGRNGDSDHLLAGRRVYAVTHLEFDPSKQDLFGYLEELRRAVRRLDDLNERLPAAGRVIMSENYVRSRLVRAARKVPTYKTVIDNLIILPVDQWSILSVEALYAKLEAAKANDASVSGAQHQDRSMPELR